MNKIARFEKVSYEQFKKDMLDTFNNLNDYEEDYIKFLYKNIELPKRSTSGSAGYDFHCPCNITIKADEFVKIPTGIKCYMEDGWVLQCYPRSSYGFKYGIRLSNTIGIVDEDYYNNSNNEGHIFIKLINDSAIAKPINIRAGDAFCQGIFVPYGITYDDNVDTVRQGGIGSTGN